ncbi:tetratricopeptide repeat protein [Aquipseudomonas guryensis]|uniref:Tetratricopeptide repeat protein n=1 Tax=Aquipseudomonas guryensis TaxID=2759165 RepID=A0A7W4DEK6_9GAMM|nr:tetratricopeptide repeat protein [Pseudomonas guryensis]MBB1521162.1 tetratricopeptide repeat protein [Pseudomonas guryensis]
MRSLMICCLLAALAGCAGFPGERGDLLDRQRQASEAYAAGDYARASLEYRYLSEQLPKDADLRYRLGNSLAQEGEVDGAMQAYREALLRDSKHAKAWHNLIYLQLQGVGQSVAEMYLHIDRNDPRVAPVASKAEAVMRVFEVPLEPAER